MDDRELLKAAAKAAGIRYDAEASKPHPKSGAFWGLWLTFDHEPSEYDRRYWTPLTDDGDALRLAVKLRIKFRYNEALGQALAWTVGAGEMDDSRANIEDCGRNEFACARRAIVRAAAALASHPSKSKGETE